MTAIRNPPARKLAGKCEGVGDENHRTYPSHDARDGISLSTTNVTAMPAALDGCSRVHHVDRRMRALAMGDAVRMDRARIKKELHSGELHFDDLLTDLPHTCAKVPIVKLMQWVPGVRAKRAHIILQEIAETLERPVSEDVPAGELSTAVRELVATRTFRYQATRIGLAV